jgi:hypothetical protein
MNHGSNSFSASNATDAATVSPCSDAYDSCSSAQERLHGALCKLRTNLDVVLRPAPPQAGSTSIEAVPKGADSEMHGRFLAIRERTEDDIHLVEDLLSRLTV